MKNILAWVKSNLLIVIFCAIIVLSLPAAFVASSLWRSGTLEAQKKVGDTELQSVSKLDVTYTLPNYEPGKPPIELKTYPHADLTKWFKDNKQKLSQASTAIVQRVEDFNLGKGPEAARVGRSEFKPLIEGLFPQPKPEDDESQKLNEMEEALLGKKGHPNPYMQLLDSARAGPPADPIKVAESLADQNQREMEKITAGKRALTQEEQFVLNKQLAERRLSEYQAAAKVISVYADLDSLPNETAGRSIARGRIEPDSIKAPYLFLYQWDLWTLQDIFAAVRLANTDSSGTPTEVDRSVVKRIEKIRLLAPKGTVASRDDPVDGTASTEVVAAIPGMVPQQVAASITAREMGPNNKVYDIRRVRLTAVVSSARINDFLDALTRTNLMSVTDLDVSAVDEWNDLKEGYHYGAEGVVRAEMDIETIWLRSWTLPLMPKQIASLLGASAEAPGAEGAGRADAPVDNSPEPVLRGRGSARPPG